MSVGQYLQAKLFKILLKVLPAGIVLHYNFSIETPLSWTSYMPNLNSTTRLSSILFYGFQINGFSIAKLNVQKV
jgi:hypothetical protein